MILVRVPWVPNGKWAVTIAPFVFILPAHAEDKALIAHEQQHLDQIAAMGWARWYWKYVFDRDFRREQEREGYAVQRNYKEVG